MFPILTPNYCTAKNIYGNRIYSFRLSKAKDRLSKDEGSRCKFFIHKYSLLYSVQVTNEQLFEGLCKKHLCLKSVGRCAT